MVPVILFSLSVEFYGFIRHYDTKCEQEQCTSSTMLYLSYLCDTDNAVSVVSSRKERYYLTTHSTHFIYGYMASRLV